MPNIASQRLRNQQISHKKFDHPADIVRWMGAIQAQDFLAALWAVGVRSASGLTQAGVEQALAERTFIRTWPMRGTLHFVTAEDARWMLRLLTPRVIRSSERRHRELDIDEDVLFKSRKLTEAALQGGKQLTRAELYSVFESGGIAPEGQRGYHILGWLAQKEVICWGPRRGKQHTFVLLDEWIPAGKMLTHDEALAELASRYIRSHGPATEYDFAAWTGLTVSISRKALAMVSPELLRDSFDGQTYWFSEPETVPDGDSRSHLLPAFDEILCGYRDRSPILNSEHRKSAILKNGIVRPVMIRDGNVTGAWKRTLKKDRVIIQPELFIPLNEEQKQELQSAGSDYGNFLGLSAEFTFQVSG